MRNASHFCDASHLFDASHLCNAQMSKVSMVG